MDRSGSSARKGSVRPGQVGVQGGWYDLEVRALNGGTVLCSTVTERVGVGEVFIIAQAIPWRQART